MISDPYQIIKRPLVTEKTTVAQEGWNAYAFVVDRRANKVEIRKAVESIFEVKVVSVRTLVRKGKPRRVKHRIHHQPSRKHAVVRLAEGEMIEALSN